MADHITHDELKRRPAEVEAGPDEVRPLEASPRGDEARCRLLLQRLGQGYCELELVRDENGRAVDQRYVELNPAFERLFGIPAADATGRTARAVFPGLEPWWTEAFDRIARRGEPERIEHRVAALDRWFEAFVYPDGGDRLTILYEDVTERRRAQARLRKSEARQAFLLRLGDALRAGSGTHGLVEAAARLLGEHLGASRIMFAEFDEARGVADIFHGWFADGAEPFPAVMRLEDYEGPILDDLRQGRTVRIEDTRDPALARPDLAAIAELGVAALLSAPLIVAGRLVVNLSVHQHAPRRWTDDDVALVGEVAERLWADLVRARAEARLRESEERYRSVFDGIDEGFCVWEVVHDADERVVDLRFLDVNPAFERQTGLSDVVGRLVSEVAPGTEAEWIETYGEVARTGVSKRFEMFHGDTGRWYDIYASRLRGPHSPRVSIVFNDISERKRAEARLRESEEALASDLANTELLRGLAERLVTEENVSTIYDEILSAAVTVARADAGTIQTYDPRTRSLEIIASRNFSRQVNEHFHRVDASSRTACGVALSTGQRAFVDFADEVADLGCGLLVDEGLRSAMALPLVSRTGVPLGMLNTHWREAGHRPTERQLRYLDLVARQAADLVEQRQAQSALRESEERLREFGEASQDVLWIRDAETLQWQYLTPAFETIYGLGREEALAGDSFRNWTDLIHPEDRHHALEGMRRVREGERATFEYRIRRPIDGGLRWLRNTDFPMRDDAGQVVRIGGVGQDVTELKRIEAALQDSEGRLRTLMEGIPQLVWRSCDRGLWTWSSPQWQAFTGQTLEESHGQGWLDAVHPDDHAATLAAWEAARPHGLLDVEYRVRRASDGTYLWHHTRSVPVRDEGGRIVEWLGTSTDVQQFKKLQERQAVMVAELQHRTRNLIAVVRSIAAQTMAETGPGEAFRAAFNDRMAALSRVQGLLSRAESEPITIGHLIRLELDALGAAEAANRIVLDGPEVPLRNSLVQTLALAVHELATNARKYGALATEQGRLAVTWRVREADGAGRRLGLEWVEEGLDRAREETSPASSGYGRELIERALPYALGARTSFELGETGLRCTIDLPLSQREPGRPR